MNIDASKFWCPQDVWVQDLAVGDNEKQVSVERFNVFLAESFRLNYLEVMFSCNLLHGTGKRFPAAFPRFIRLRDGADDIYIVRQQTIEILGCELRCSSKENFQLGCLGALFLRFQHFLSNMLSFGAGKVVYKQPTLQMV